MPPTIHHTTAQPSQATRCQTQVAILHLIKPTPDVEGTFALNFLDKYLANNGEMQVAVSHLQIVATLKPAGLLKTSLIKRSQISGDKALNLL
jgi:hypothetical protein